MDILQADQQSGVNVRGRPVAHGKGEGGKRRKCWVGARGKAPGSGTWLSIGGITRIANTCAISVRPTTQVHRSITNDNSRGWNHLAGGQKKGGQEVSLGVGIAPAFPGVSDKLMVPFQHWNKGTAAGGNSGVRGETGSSTRAQKGEDKGGRGRHLSDPILRADAICRRCIVLVRRSVQSEVSIELPLTGGKSLNKGGKTSLAVINLNHQRNIQGILGSVLVNGRPRCGGDHGIRRHNRMRIRAHHLGAGRGEGLGGTLVGVKTGVKAQREAAVEVATVRSNSQGVTVASSQYPETNLLDSLESAEVEGRNHVSNLIVEIWITVCTAQNVNNVRTTIVSTRRSIRKSMNGQKTTFTSSNSPPHRGGGRRRKREGIRGTHRVISPVAKGQASHQRKFTGSKSPASH